MNNSINYFEHLKFRKPRTDEQLQNITQVRTGLTHKPHKKHVWKEGHSEETKHKISEALKGRQMSPTTKEKLSNARKGKPLSKETRQKISEARKARCVTRSETSEARVIRPGLH